MSGVDSTEPRFSTPDGVKSYAEVSDLIAEYLSVLVDDVQSGDYGASPLDVDLIKHFHQAFLEPIVPNIAGVWRTKPVQVGSHIPPHHWDIDRLMRECFDDLTAKVHYAGDDPDLQIEALAFAEANVLRIHPFADSTAVLCGYLLLSWCGASTCRWLARGWSRGQRVPSTRRR
jgi:Fic/DOC family